MQHIFLTQYIQSSFLLRSFNEDLSAALINMYNAERGGEKKKNT